MSTLGDPGVLPALSGVPELHLRQGRYELRFARSREEIEEILRLRFRVFNLEMGEGLRSSFVTEMDEDRFDRVCHHLLVEDTATGAVIGTYRMQTQEMAAEEGFYSSGEFDLATLPQGVVGRAVEVGRAAIDRRHRSRQVLFLLWKGLAAYLQHTGKRYLFGCCSLSSQDPAQGLRLLRQLQAADKQSTRYRVGPRTGYECLSDEASVAATLEVEVPQLFATYLRYGAKVLGPPAMDREFKTIDFFVLLDAEGLSPRTYRIFFG